MSAMFNGVPLAFDLRVQCVAGYAPGTEYVRRFYTPTLGPTCMLVWERLVEAAFATAQLGYPEPCDVAELFREIGVNVAHVHRSTLTRLVVKRVISRTYGRGLLVAGALPRLRDVDVERLPPRLAALHATLPVPA